MKNLFHSLLGLIADLSQGADAAPPWGWGGDYHHTLAVKPILCRTYLS